MRMGKNCIVYAVKKTMEGIARQLSLFTLTFRFASRFMIQCDKCQDWFHVQCIGLTKKAAQAIESYVCPLCRPTPPGL